MVHVSGYFLSEATEAKVGVLIQKKRDALKIPARQPHYLRIFPASAITSNCITLATFPRRCLESLLPGLVEPLAEIPMQMRQLLTACLAVCLFGGACAERPDRALSLEAKARDLGAASGQGVLDLLRGLPHWSPR